MHVVRGGPAKGLRMFVNDRAPAFRQMIEGSYDAFLHEAIASDAPPAIVLDVGAHIGYHALAFAARFPAAQVVAMEPNPVNVARIQAQLRLEPALATRITVLPLALADENGDTVMRASAQIEDQTSSGGYLGSVRPGLPEADYARAGFRDINVKVRRLDDLVTEHGWQGIGLVKIDVEGAEHLVLRGAVEMLRRDHPLLLVEIHSVACMLHVQELLHPMGYRAELLHEEDARRAFILARYHPVP